MNLFGSKVRANPMKYIRKIIWRNSRTCFYFLHIKNNNQRTCMHATKERTTPTTMYTGHIESNYNHFSTTSPSISTVCDEQININSTPSHVYFDSVLCSRQSPYGIVIISTYWLGDVCVWLSFWPQKNNTWTVDMSIGAAQICTLIWYQQYNQFHIDYI